MIGLDLRGLFQPVMLSFCFSTDLVLTTAKTELIMLQFI